MPAIIQYEEQRSVSGAAGSVPRGNPGAQTSGLNVLAQVAERLGERKEAEAATAASASFESFKAVQKNRLEKMSREGSVNALTKNFLREYDEAAAALIASGKTSRSRLILKTAATSERGMFEATGYDIELKASDTATLNNAENATELVAADAEIDPANYQRGLDRLRDTLSNLPATPEQRIAFDSAAVEIVTTRAAIGYARKDPDATMQRLIEPAADDELFRALSPQGRDRVLEAVESTQRQRITAENRTFQIAERAERDAQDAASKDGDRLLAGGTLTSEWIERNRGRLSPDDYRYFYRAMSGEGGRVNREVYSDLRTRASLGEDVRADARAALHRGDLDIAKLDTLFTEVESTRPGWYKRGTQYLSSASGYSDLNPTPDRGLLRANMLDDWQLWADEHPKAGDDEAMKAYRRIASEYAVIDRDKLSITLRRPAYMTDRNNPNLDAIEALTVEAFEKGEIDQAELERQAILLKQWREATRAAGQTSPAVQQPP